MEIIIAICALFLIGTIFKLVRKMANLTEIFVDMLGNEVINTLPADQQEAARTKYNGTK